LVSFNQGYYLTVGPVFGLIVGPVFGLIVGPVFGLIVGPVAATSCVSSRSIMMIFYEVNLYYISQNI
jgi:hypothetical protein